MPHLARHGVVASDAQPDHPVREHISPSLLERALRAFARIYFRYALRRADLMPRGPCIIVGHHGGIGIADAICLMGEKTHTFGARAMVGMMHGLFIDAPIVGYLARRMGAVRASRDAARRALHDDSRHRETHPPTSQPGGCQAHAPRGRR